MFQSEFKKLKALFYPLGALIELVLTQRWRNQSVRHWAVLLNIGVRGSLIPKGKWIIWGYGLCIDVYCIHVCSILKHGSSAEPVKKESKEQ